jgi:hypothetical protein
MKRLIVPINVFMALTVLFSILIQSAHSYEHHLEQLAIKKCEHHYSKNKTQINHSHQTIENCFTCSFSFSFFTKTVPSIFETPLNTIEEHVLISFFQPYFSFFKGSLYSLRAPPLV